MDLKQKIMIGHQKTVSICVNICPRPFFYPYPKIVDKTIQFMNAILDIALWARLI